MFKSAKQQFNVSSALISLSLSRLGVEINISPAVRCAFACVGSRDLSEAQLHRQFPSTIFDQIITINSTKIFTRLPAGDDLVLLGYADKLDFHGTCKRTNLNYFEIA